MASAVVASLLWFPSVTTRVGDKPGAQPIKVTDGTLKFDNVSFAYPTVPDHKVLSNISFRANVRSRVWLMRGRVGKAGNGC